MESQEPSSSSMVQTCKTCKDILRCGESPQCGNPMVYLNHTDNTYKVTDDTPACGFYTFDPSGGFQFTQIEGYLSLEDATKELVHLAECIQRTHNNESAVKNRMLMQTLFNSRKAGAIALLDLIEAYIHQMPDQLGRSNDELAIPHPE